MNSKCTCATESPLGMLGVVHLDPSTQRWICSLCSKGIDAESDPRFRGTMRERADRVAATEALFRDAPPHRRTKRR